MISIEPGSGPTVRRILLGTQLRRLRESKGITREEAGYRIRASESKISRMELGRVATAEPRHLGAELTRERVVEVDERLEQIEDDRLHRE